MTILTDHELTAGAAQQDAHAWHDDVALGAARLLAAVERAPDPKPAREGRTTQQVADVARITYRQADHWATHGYLGPMPAVGTGNPRVWSDAQTARAIILGALVRAGLPVPGVSIRVHTGRLPRNAGLPGPDGDTRALDEQTQTVQPTMHAAAKLSGQDSTDPMRHG